MNAANPSDDAIDDLVAQCVLVYERDGDIGVDALLHNQPVLGPVARARFLELRDAGLLLPPRHHPEQIGPYRVLRHLGTGGMGSVYLAEQRTPVERQVAIKVIRPGMDSQEVLARFAVERQALALLDHPHLARIHDAGLTDDGRPYLVMEHVDGVPLLRYCDERHLPTAARLRLFVEICAAVQHAHQKGVVHRDLKPSNVLVAERAGQPWPVVIDFGVAKAVQGRLAERSTVTLPGQLLGTPEYMSPEQVRNELDIDTRTDVYSLGVVLFELLTGTLPFRPQHTQRRDQAHLRQLLDESDPPTPSSRLTDLGADAAAIADRRATDLPSLQKRVRGDLDWIVLKAIARDRDRRYGMPAELAADLERHLRDEPVLAGPPTTRYRLGKFLRRNRLQVGASATIALAVVTGLGASLWFWRDAVASERTAMQHAARAEQNLTRALGATKELLRLGSGELLDLPHMEPVRRQLMEKALALFAELEAIDTTGDARSRWHVADAQRMVGSMQLRLGRVDEAVRNLQSARRRFEQLARDTIDADQHDRALATAETALADGLLMNGGSDAIGTLLQRAVGRLRRLHESRPTDADLRAQLLEGLLAYGQYARRFDRPLALTLCREADAVAAPWREDPATTAPPLLAQALLASCEHAALQNDLGEPAAARTLLQAVARDLALAVPSDAPPLRQRTFLYVYRRTADLLFDLEQREAALPVIERALQITNDLLREHPAVVPYHVHAVRLHTNLFVTQNRQGDNAAAQRAYEACLAAAEALLAIDGSPSHRYLLAFALVHGAYGRMFHQGLGGEVDAKAARADCDKGLAIVAELPAELRSSHHTRRLEATALHCRAMDRTNRGELAAAIDDYATAAELLDSLVRDADDVQFREHALFMRTLRADLLLRQGRIGEARPVYEMAFAALQELKDRHSRPDDWRVKERNVRSALARTRGLSGDVDGAVELFATLGHDENDWVGRDFAGKGLLETCLALPANDPRRTDLLQRARTVLVSSFERGHAVGRNDAMVQVMRAGTQRILAEVEQTAGDWPAAAAAWAAAVEGYAPSFEGRPSDRNRERLAAVMSGHGKALLQVPDVAAARAVADRMGSLFAGKPVELLAAAALAARCDAASAGTQAAAAHHEAGVLHLLAALAAGYRDGKALAARPEFAPLLADPRVVQALAALR